MAVKDKELHAQLICDPFHVGMERAEKEGTLVNITTESVVEVLARLEQSGVRTIDQPPVRATFRPGQLRPAKVEQGEKDQ